MTASFSLGMRYHFAGESGTRMTLVWLATFTFEDAHSVHRRAVTVGGLTGAPRREDPKWWYLGSGRFTSEQVVSGRNVDWSVILHRFGEMALA